MEDDELKPPANLAPGWHYFRVSPDGMRGEFVAQVYQPEPDDMERARRLCDRLGWAANAGRRTHETIAAEFAAVRKEAAAAAIRQAAPPRTGDTVQMQFNGKTLPVVLTAAPEPAELPPGALADIHSGRIYLPEDGSDLTPIRQAAPPEPAEPGEPFFRTCPATAAECCYTGCRHDCMRLAQLG